MENIFYKNNFLNINFLITDETHIGNTFYKNILFSNKINVLKNTIFVEKFITIKDLFFSYFSALHKILDFKKIFQKKIIVNGINIGSAINNLLVMSLINYSKLNIYNNSLRRILQKYQFKKFHYYMFEYNFGFYLNNTLKKNNSKLNTIGYQHGIYSDKLMWMSLINQQKLNKRYLPETIISKYQESKNSYKKIFPYVEIRRAKKNTMIINLKFSKNKKTNKILVLLGLHDSSDMIYSLIDDKKKFLGKKIILKKHPKAKELNIKNLPNNFIFKDKLETTYDNILISTTSTMVYDFIGKNFPFEILIPAYMNMLVAYKNQKKY